MRGRLQDDAGGTLRTALEGVQAQWLRDVEVACDAGAHGAAIVYARLIERLGAELKPLQAPTGDW